MQDPMKDPIVRNILKIKLPEKLTQVEGTYFKDTSFPDETLKALMKHPKITLYEAEEAIYTTEIIEDLEQLVQYIFNTHPYITGKMELERYDERSPPPV